MNKVKDSKKTYFGSIVSGDDVIVGVIAEKQSVSVPGWIVAHNSLSDRAVRLWGYLAGALHGVFTLPGTSHKSLAVLLDVSERTAREAIYELRDAGALSVVPRFKDGKQLGNAYYLWPSTPDDTKGARVAADCHDGDVLPTVNINTNSNVISTQNSDAVSDTPDSGLAKASRGADYSIEFEALWRIYPRRINKSGAYKSYKAAIRRGASYDDLMLATKNYASERIGQDEKFTMHGSTFFGPQARWRDFLPNASSAPKEDMTDEQIIAAIIYDDYDSTGVWYATPEDPNDDPVSCVDNPAKHGYTRPVNGAGQLVNAEGVPYVLDAQGIRRRVDYLN
mgnify:CR=1 FL=1